MGALPQPNIRRTEQQQPRPQSVAGKKPPLRSESPTTDTPPAPSGKLFVKLYDQFIDALTEGCENGAAVELKLILQIMKLANARSYSEPGEHAGWCKPITRPKLAELIGCEEQNLRCQWARLFGEGSLLEFIEGPAAVQEGIVRTAPKNSVCCRIRFEIATEWLKSRRAARQAAKEEAARKRAEIDAAAAEAVADAEEEPRFRAVRRSLLPRPVRIGPKTPLCLSEEQQSAMAVCTKVKFKTDGELREFSVVEGLKDSVVILDFAPTASAAKSEERANKSASLLADPGSQSPAGVDELSAALVARGLTTARHRVVIVQTALSSVPLPFFLRVLDEKIAKARSKRQDYNPAWLETTARDAGEAWREEQRVNSASRSAAAADGSPDIADIQRARMFLENRADIDPDLIEWAEALLRRSS